MTRGFYRGWAAIALGSAVLLAACGDDAGGSSSASSSKRTVDVVASSTGCTPTSVQVTRGETLVLNVKNNAGAERRVEGASGTKLDRLVVPAGASKSAEYTVPASGEPGTLSCSGDGASATQISLQASGAGSTPASKGGTTEPGY